MVADLAKMPHCLVAGTTGSGKSVGINAMILSLLYKAEARDVRLILIDPKMLELSVYEGIPHLLCPVVIDMKQAANALNWCVGEMERRYKLMSRLGVRNLAGYNKKIARPTSAVRPLPNPFSLTPEAPEPLERLPYIVVLIDELADLMMVVGKKIEELIARLAQKARASGIHLVLATQRPSVDVITGLIKANMPTRHDLPGQQQDRHRAPSSTRWARRRCWARATCSTCRRAAGFRSACTAPSSPTRKCTASSNTCAARASRNYIDGVLEGGVLEGEAEERAAGEGGAERRSRSAVRPGRGHRAEAPPRVDLAGAAPSAHRLQPRRAAGRADGRSRAWCRRWQSNGNREVHRSEAE